MTHAGYIPDTSINAYQYWGQNNYYTQLPISVIETDFKIRFNRVTFTAFENEN